MERVSQLPCLACYKDGMYSPAEIHHVLDGGRRRGHKYVIPLCFPHHRGGFDGTGVESIVSRHPYKNRFEERYGTEDDLLAEVEEWLHERH